jgi:hypothetical protein
MRSGKRSIETNRRSIMLGKTLLSAAVALGLLSGAGPALAEYDYGLYGGPHQTWCDVDPNCNGWNQRLHGPAYRSNAFSPVTPLVQKHRPLHKRSHDANSR